MLNWTLAGTHQREALATASVNVFLQKMYFSISETMPTGFLGTAAKMQVTS